MLPPPRQRGAIARRLPTAGALLAAALVSWLTGCGQNSPGESLFAQAFTLDDPARFAYVTNSGDDTVSTYLVSGIGRLNQVNAFAYEAIETTPTKIVAHPSREFFFSTGEASSTVAVLAVDRDTGFLETVGFSSGLGFGSLDIAVSNGGNYVYTLAETSRQLTVLLFQAETAQLTQTQVLTTSSQTPSFLIADPRGRYVMTLDAQGGVLQTFFINSDGTLGAASTASVAPNLIGGAAVDIGGKNVYISVPNQDFVLRVAVNPGATNVAMVLSETVPSDSDPDLLAMPTTVRLHPSGRFVYVLNPGADNIFFYRIDKETFELEPLGALPSEPEAIDLVFEPEGNTAYLIDPPGNRLIRYTWDFETGILEPREEIRTRQAPSSMAFLQETERAQVVPETLYVANAGSSDVSVFSVGEGQGELTPLGSPVVSGTEPLGLALDRRQRFLFTVNGTSEDLATFRIDEDGSLTAEGLPIPLPGRPRAVTTEPLGNYLYVALQDPDQVVGFRITDDMPLASLGSALPLGDDPAAIASDPTGQWLYVANSALDEPGAPSNISIFTIDRRDGTLTPVNPSGAVPGGANSLGFSPFGVRLYTTLFAAGSTLPADISPTLGTLAVVPPPTPTGPGPSDVVITSTGRYAFVAVRDVPPSGVVQLYDVSNSDGALINEDDDDSQTPRQVVTAGMEPVALLADPGEDFLYSLGNGSGTVSVFGIASDGILSPVQETGTGLSPVDLVLRSRLD